MGDKRTGKKPKRPDVARGKHNIALSSAVAPEPTFDYPVFSLRHLVKGYTLAECSKELRALFAAKLYNMSQKTWIELEIGNHRSGAGFEQMDKKSLVVPVPSIVTEDVSKLHVMRFNGKTGRIIGLRSRHILHITHIEIDKSAYDHGS